MTLMGLQRSQAASALCDKNFHRLLGVTEIIRGGQNWFRNESSDVLVLDGVFESLSELLPV